MDKVFVKQFVNDWIEAWNAHDIDRVLSHYTDDFEMSSPFIVQRMKESSGTLKGKEKIQPYWQIGLEQIPALRFEFLDVLVGANSITILYRNQKSVLVAEVLVFNADGKAIKGMAHYAEKQEL